MNLEEKLEFLLDYFKGESDRFKDYKTPRDLEKKKEFLGQF